jgi:site-specific recombinase XerD
MSGETNLRKLHESFLEELRKKGRSNSTVIAYGKDIEQLLDFLANKAISDIPKVTYEDLDAFKKSLEGEKYTNKSISRKINSIRTFYRYLMDQKVIGENIASKLEHPKFETAPPRILSEIEYRALRDSCRNDQRLYSIVEILLQTGIRIGELTRLELSDVNMDDSIPQKTMRVSAFGSHPERVVPLNNSAVDAIKKYLAIRPETDSKALFVTKYGNPLLVRNIRTSIDRAFKKAGIKDAKVNDLRNTFIAHHLSRGTSLVTVSKLVGHKRISTTEKYLGLLEGDATKQVQLEEL